MTETISIQQVMGSDMSKKFVFAFAEGDGKNKKLLGGKGANLCEMTQIGLNVPPGFVISTEACLAYLGRWWRVRLLVFQAGLLLCPYLYLLLSLHRGTR